MTTISAYGTPAGASGPPVVRDGGTVARAAPAAQGVARAASAPEPQLPTVQTRELAAVVAEIKQWVEAKAPNTLAFSIDDETGRTVIRIADAQTGELIRQIPPEEVLAIARSLDKMQGLLLQKTA